MKLRIQGNSIRIRLSQTEVTRLASGDPIVQKTTFSAGCQLVSCVETSPDAKQPVATFEGGRLAVALSLPQVRAWAGSEEVSIETDQPIPDGQSLHLLIEKDFECLHRRAEGDKDAFPNPRKAADG